MDSETLRTKFLEFFEKRGHVVVPSSSLLPDDPSVLLTTAGMQQFKKYFTGELNAKKDFLLPNGSPAKGTASIQKSFRTSDIDEVGDERHLTFFEMLGNFSFGGYFKEDAIRYAHDFMKEIGLEIEYVTVFAGDENVPEDKESREIWQKLGIKDIRGAGKEDNFWGPTGSEGPCGPTTEIYIQGVEIWNIVFNQFYCDKNKKLVSLKIQGVDTGMGLERLAMVSQGKSNVFETDLLKPIIEVIKKLAPKYNVYDDNTNNYEQDENIRRWFRIIADHSRSAVMLISDGVIPSNKTQGNILRRIITEVVSYSRILDISKVTIPEIAEKVFEIYKSQYSELELKEEGILDIFRKEIENVDSKIEIGLKEFAKYGDSINAEIAFRLHQSFGLPFEWIKRMSGQRINDDELKAEIKKHQEISRVGAVKKFGGHGLLLDTGELKAANEEELKIVTRLHTTTHLLQAALRKVLGENVHQAGSDITVERTRFDFTFGRKLTAQELQKVEDLVNGAVQKDLSMGFENMPFKQAIESGALYSPREKYPEIVKVYTAKDQKTGEVFSKELCGGPHVARTSEIGRVKIIKQEAASSGIRRIRAVLL